MGHVGLTPQSVHQLRRLPRAGPRRRADTSGVLRDARAVEEAGAFAVVLECVPAELGARDHARALDPDHRHRRRRRLRRPGAGDARPARPDREPAAALRAPLRRDSAEIVRDALRRDVGRRRPRRGSSPAEAESYPDAADRDRGALSRGRSSAVSDEARARAGGASRSCRRWARCTRGTCSLVRRGSRARRPRGRVDLRQPDAVRPDARTSRATRATSRATSRCCAEVGVDVVFAPSVEEIYPSGDADLRSTVERLDERALRAQPPRALPRRDARSWRKLLQRRRARTSRSSARRTTSSSR